LLILITVSSGILWATPVPRRQSDAGSSEKGDTAETSQQSSGLTDDGSASVSQSEPGDQDNTFGKQMFKDFAEDQKAIWTSPLHVHLADAEWLVPLGGAAAAMFATDTEVSKHLSNSPSRLSTSNNLSNYGIATLGAAAGGMYIWGHFTHNDHMRETGFLAMEAAANALGDTYGLKYALRRERPLQDNYQGQFWHGGDGFPSEHSSAAWSIASVIAHEYPGPVTSVVAYGLAAAISSARVTGKDHFPSDVLVGSALGWFIGQEVYRRHHDPTLGGGDWETYAESHERGPGRPSNNIGSPYVELDSWVYPALAQLVAVGYINDAFLGLRPWTRRECARLLQEAVDQSNAADRPAPETDRLIDALQKEFAPEISTDERDIDLRFDSVYTRYRNISGEPLRDGYDFAQTIINDYGRPYAQGSNEIAGTDAWASAGPLVGYARVEYQGAPSAPALPASARQLIGTIETTYTPFPNAIYPSVNRVDLIEGYAGLTLDNWQITYGKQAEWWGPSGGGPMMFSNNAEPIAMFRINRVTPFKLPSVMRFLGPMRTEFFLGQLAGQHWIGVYQEPNIGSYTTLLNPQPFIHGEAFSFEPTPNVEFGFNRTTIFGGPTKPFTPHTFISSLFSLGNATPGGKSDPGDRRSGFNLSYRLPFVRKWLSFYADGFSEDEFSPVAYWDRSAWISGLYLSRVPHFRKLDLRVEGVYTDLPIGGSVGHGFFYFNSTYLDGYTNWGNLIGSWIGREGQGAQAWSTYWLSPRDKLQFQFRHQKVSKQLIPGGGTLTDLGVNVDFLVRSSLDVSGAVQYERWDFPVLASTKKNNVTTSLQFTYWPSLVFLRGIGSRN
jgi:membrane-associated phospholipid phosphatase